MLKSSLSIQRDTFFSLCKGPYKVFLDSDKDLGGLPRPSKGTSGPPGQDGAHGKTTCVVPVGSLVALPSFFPFKGKGRKMKGTRRGSTTRECDDSGPNRLRIVEWWGEKTRVPFVVTVSTVKRVTEVHTGFMSSLKKKFLISK